METKKSCCQRPLTGAIGAAFVLLLTELLKRKTGIGSTSVYPPDSADLLYEGELDTFDFVIVGGGTAGSVLANRLSKIEHFTVLILEAGNFPSTSSVVPGLFMTLLNSPEDWNFTAEYDKQYCQGTKSKTCKLKLGKVLGGSSTLHNAHHTRLNPNDLNKWFEDDLGEYWTAEKIETHMYRIEQYVSVQPQPINYGNDGEIPLQTYNSLHPIKDLIFEAAEEILYGKLKYGEFLGFTEVLGTIFNGTKINSAKAFLKPVNKRKNLYLSLNSEVQKLIFTSPREKKVGAVEVKIRDKTLTIKARKEVLLCAGPINSPKLLMLSGIGPRAHLEEMQIPVMSDIPVGENLQDHFSLFVCVTLDAELAPEVTSMPFLDAIYDYVTKREGEFNKLNINDLVGYISTHLSHVYPNIAIDHFYFERNGYLLWYFLDILGFDDATQNSILEMNTRRPIIIFSPQLITPDSTGYVRLKSDSYSDPPVIYPRYFHAARDWSRLVKAYRFVQQLVETKAMQNMKAEMFDFDIPQCRKLKFQSEEYINCTLRTVGYPLSHLTGTTKMGSWYDDCTVVGDTLSVKGCQGLRVVGSSAIPHTISANTIATVAMMAARVSEIIKKKWVPNYVLDGTVFTPGEDIC